jgi:hypothetical protein
VKLNRQTLAHVAAILTAVAALITAIVSTGPATSPAPKVAVSPTADGKQIRVPAAAVQRVQASEAGRHVELGPGVDTPATAKRDNQAASTEAPRIVGPPPLASPHQAGCLTRSNSSNFSYRAGIRPSLVVLHLTVSPNAAGWGDVNGVWSFLNRPSTQASANYINDAEGHCVYAVPETAKAWAQANFNSATACSIEQVNYGNSGHETSYAGAAGLKQLARIVHDCAARWHVPLREARVSGCSVVRSGVIDHDHLGGCGGGHNDVTPYGPGCARRAGGTGVNTWPCVDAVVAAAKGGPAPASKHASDLCREYAHYRREVNADRKDGGHRFPESRRPRAVAVRDALAKHRYRCTSLGRAVRK